MREQRRQAVKKILKVQYATNGCSFYYFEKIQAANYIIDFAMEIGFKVQFNVKKRKLYNFYTASSSELSLVIIY